MPATDDRWDVVVVGLRDPSQTAARMATAELAHYASLPPQDVERMLEEGEVPVLENLDRAEAERAAYELTQLGVVVDLRLAMNDSGVFPVFKPDAERQIGVAVGGLIDDSATPPTVGAAVGLPQLEPDLEAPQAPRRPRPDSQASRYAMHREPASPASRSAATPAPRDGGGRPPREAVPTPRADGGTGRSRAATPTPARAPTSPARPKDEEASIDALLGDIGPGPSVAAPAPAPAPKLPQRLQRAAAPPGPVEVEIDFAAAGLAAPPKRGPIHAPAPAPEPLTDRSASAMPRRTRAGHMGGTGASAAGHARDREGLLDVLRGDAVAATLVGLAVGLGLALVLALQMQRSGTRDRLPPLEEELAAALSDPTGAGKHRDPGVIEAEIDGALGDIQRSFLLWWLVPGIGVGLLLSRLRGSG